MIPRAGSPGDAAAAAHELLLRLAGRLPERLLWRLREWLATGAHDVVATTLPRALLRQRVGLTDAERDLLETAVAGHGAAHRVLDAILALPASDGPEATFGPPEDPDVAALSLLAVVRADAGCVELRQAVRTDGQRSRRVVLVRTEGPHTGGPHAGAPDGVGERPWVLAGTLARLLRAHGDPAPCVEVLPTAAAPPPYHRAALAGSTPLWQRSQPRAAAPHRAVH